MVNARTEGHKNTVENSSGGETDIYCTGAREGKKSDTFQDCWHQHLTIVYPLRYLEAVLEFLVLSSLIVCVRVRRHYTQSMSCSAMKVCHTPPTGHYHSNTRCAFLFGSTAVETVLALLT